MWVFFCFWECFYNLFTIKRFLNIPKLPTADFFSWSLWILMRFLKISLTCDYFFIFLISSFLTAYLQIIKACPCTNWEFITSFLQSAFFFYISYLCPLKRYYKWQAIKFCIFPNVLSAKPECDRILSSLVIFLHNKNFFCYYPILMRTNLFMQYFLRSIATKLHVLKGLKDDRKTFIAKRFRAP